MARFRLPLPSRLGLRARITFAFAASAAILSALLAGTTWGLTRESLLNQREAAAVRQTQFNARFMQTQLATGTDRNQLVDSLTLLETPSGSRPSIDIRADRKDPSDWAAIQPVYGESAVPDSLQDLVDEGTAARMRFNFNGEPELAIGVPLTGNNASYYEIVSLSEVESTLGLLAISLVGASLVTTVVGGGLGYWLSRRTLRPLSSVGLAAEAIAGGRLDTRLEGAGDPDLNVLVTSFNHMASALEERIDRDGRFASDVSHELRSPLMTLAASVSVLASRRDEMPDESSRSAVDLMEADVARFQQLVDDLLEMSRFDAGVARLSLEEIRLPELVRQVVAQFSDTPVPVMLEADVAGLVVRADKRRLVRVLANLLGNASAYGGGATSVAVSSAGEAVRITVEDAGTGVAPEDRERIFDRFSRGSGAGRRSSGGDGVGLGLALVAEHARLHGGRVWVEERADGAEGARFVVELPVHGR